MPSAFVLITCDPGEERSLIPEMRKIEGVKEVSGTYGVYDIIAEVEGKTVEALKDSVTLKIRRLEKVRSTVTLIVIQGKEE